jgi:hypothetical protein
MKIIVRVLDEDYYELRTYNVHSGHAMKKRLIRY